MAEHKMKPTETLTPKFRVSFPELYEAKSFKQGKPKFSVQMLFDKKADLSALKNIVKVAIKDQWGDNPPKGITLPFKDGNEKELEGYQDMIVATASTQYKPQVVDQKGEPILAHDDVYAGSYARAYIGAYAWEMKEGKSVLKRGVSFNLNMVQKLADGERFVKRADASSVFGIVEDTSSTHADIDEDDFLN